MSTWRDIWRYGVIANRIFSEDSQKGLMAIRELSKVYGKDGMIHYIYAEALENKNLLEPARKEYQIAKDLFPVAHWKDVAQDSINRINQSKTPEEYFGYKFEIKTNKKGEQEYFIETKFKKLLWYGFQKVYSFTYLNDFARYISLSALSRGSSEWPLSLVDFRTVLELEIKLCFPEIIEEFNDTNRYSLFKTIEKLNEKDLIDNSIRKSFDNIRMAGNIATHTPASLSDDYKKINVAQFIKVLEFFNDFAKKHDVTLHDINDYPLCQLTLAQLKKKIKEERRDQS